MRRWLTLMTLALATAAVGAGCYDHGTVSGPGAVAPTAPANLSYQLDPSGAPGYPSGILLRWDVESDPNLASYRVYSRASSSANYDLRGETTSNTFHDDGTPDLQYYVTAVGVSGGESNPSNVVTVNEALALSAPATLTSISLDGAVHLSWDDSPFLTQPNAFSYYRVYSAGYNLDQNLCDSTWSIEGTTVSPTFLVGALTNGVPMCFAVSAISVEGYESAWSPLRDDTPRPDGRNLILYAVQDSASLSGFRFWLDANSDGIAQPTELGLTGAGASPLMDFYVDSTAAGLAIVPQRSGDSVTVYGSGPIADLTSIDVAPLGGYSNAPLPAEPMYGYVFQINDGGPYYQYGAIRITAVGTNYVIFDWSYQTDPGNPELLRQGK